MRDFSTDHRWLSINTATVRRQRGRDWGLLDILDACAARGIRAVSPWRDQVAAAGLANVASRLTTHGIELSGYCRGGMFTYTDDAGHRQVRDDNLRALDEACTLQSPCLVLVVGGLPGALAGRPAHHDIAGAREQVREGIAWLLEQARTRRMPLAIEPLHPMYADARSAVLSDLSIGLRAIICQRLIRNRDGEQQPAVEILLNTALIAELIKNGEFTQIKEAMEQSLYPLPFFLKMPWLFIPKVAALMPK